MSALLDVRIARKRFGTREVLRDIHLRLRPGEVVSLVGASGCGKSTLLRLVAGLDRDYEGEVQLDGRAVTGPTRDIRFVFQEPRLFPWLSVARNVAFDLGGHAIDSARVDALLQEVGLAGLGARLPKQLSGGQAQRVAIARGLFLQPRLLLLDEPFSAVDAFTRLKLQDLLLNVARAHHITVLLVTHDIDEAVYLSDRVIVLEAEPGRTAAQVPIELPRARSRDDPRVAAAIAEVRHALQAAHAI
ncbi:ABC transporter ATP-binding protein [Variovorax sp. LjRoot290]|uniref:ABC transporter ATP-binding protein n=1 Tax=unclassified Variovorax TaxID=663243 RepID=UPI003ECE3571